jgi:hypothetical protein
MTTDSAAGQPSEHGRFLAAPVGPSNITRSNLTYLEWIPPICRVSFWDMVRRHGTL